MKKLQHKRIILLAAVCLTTAIQAFAQTSYVSQYGLRDNVDDYYQTIPGQEGTFIKYDRPNPYTGKENRRVHGIDNLKIGNLDGKHWTGDVLTSGETKKGVYFVNAKTGEYLMWADNWGTTPTTDYNGTKFDLVCGYTCLADQKGKEGGVLAPYQVAGTTPDGVTKADRVGKGYQIQMSDNTERVIGRQQYVRGGVGTFEKRPLMVARSRDKKEYANHINDGGDQGHIVFHFYPVKKGGKQYYIIYTHRQTTAAIHNQFYINNGMKGWKTNPETEEQELVITDLAQYNKWKRLIEFDNRDSYLCLRSQKSDVSDYNVVAYKKFAGQMWYDLTQDTKYYYEDYPNSEMTSPNANGSGAKDLLDDGERTTFSDDEKEYIEANYNQPEKRFVSLEEGINALLNDPNVDDYLWKIVTHEERKKYRVAANIDKPFDVSFNVNNHGFFPFRQPYEKGTASGSQPTLERMGWEWRDAETGSTFHNHPYHATDFSYNSEFHKIGTHFYDRWGWGKKGDEATLGFGRTIKDQTRNDERFMTEGLESDYVGSIYKGSAAIRQTITGLRPGRYIAYCRAFYAPHSMMNFDNKQAFYTKEINYVPVPYINEETGEEELDYYFDGYNYTYNKPPTWKGSTSIPSDVTTAINDQPLSNNSFFFAIGKDGIERKRDIPSIYCGMMPLNAERLKDVSKEDYINNYEVFVYNALGDQMYSDEYESYVNENGETIPDWEGVNASSGLANKHSYRLMQDSTVFAMIPYNEQKYFVPRNLTGAARFFNALDETRHPEAQMYHIGLPVEVGEDGELTIGIDHKATAGNEEWVCFDNFQLIYYGDANSWDFVIDESSPQNCTRYHDLFDWEDSYTLEESRPSTASYRNTRVAIKRNLSQERFTPIVLPISLTRQQVRDAFGDDVKISEPSHITYKTIHFSAVSTDISSDADKKIVAMEAYKPYIVKPSMAPPVGSDETWDRTRFIRADDNSFGWDDGTFNYYIKNMNPKDSVFVPKAGRNHRINIGEGGMKKDIPGPLYFVDGYKIEKAVHYKPTSDPNVGNFSDVNYLLDDYNASKQWLPVGDVYVGDERMQIKGSKDGKQYQLRATCYYDPTDPAGMNKKVPAYSYFFQGGNLKFNGSAGSTQSKGFSFYLQIVETEASKTVNILNQVYTNPNATDSGSGWFKSFTSNADSGVEGVVVSAESAQNFGRGGGSNPNYRYYGIKPDAANSEKIVTITAPDGYNIAGYKIGGYCNNANETYTLTAEGGASIDITQTASTAAPASYLEKSKMDVHSTTFTVKNNTTTWNANNNHVRISTFIVYLRPVPTSGNAKVFAGNVGDFEWVPVADSEVTGVTETFHEYENPANDLYYDLQGRPVKTPKKNGIYIYRGKKIVY